MSAEEATKYVDELFSCRFDSQIWNHRYIFSVMFSPTIMLLLGGFTLSSALSKTNIDRILITKVLSFAGSKPSTVILSFMGVACFASMWIRYGDFPLWSSWGTIITRLVFSNVAAPALCFALIKVRCRGAATRLVLNSDEWCDSLFSHLYRPILHLHHA